MSRVLMAALLGAVVFSAVPGARAAAELSRALDAAAINATLSGRQPERKEAEVKISAWPRVVPKELLRIVPSAERAEFLDNLVLINGAVAELQNGILKKYFNGDFGRPLRALCSGAEDEELYYHEKPPRFVRLRTLLKDLPGKARGEFLDNLTFKNGHLVSAYVGGLRSRMSPQDLGKMLDQLACDSGKRPAAAAGAVCGAGWCTGSCCPAVRDIPGQRPGDIVCFSSCLLPR